MRARLKTESGIPLTYSVGGVGFRRSGYTEVPKELESWVRASAIFDVEERAAVAPPAPVAPAAPPPAAKVEEPSSPEPAIASDEEGILATNTVAAPQDPAAPVARPRGRPRKNA